MTKKLEWGLRFLALIFTVLCTVVLKDLGEIRPIYIMVINGLIMALILNAGTFVLSFSVARKKVKDVLLLYLVFSGFMLCCASDSLCCGVC
jgi:membrane-anchored protein YejM (alkaline phosphatase superfamily)